MKELEKLLELGNEYKIIRIEENKKDKKIIQEIYVENTKKKVRCPECNCFTNSIHDRLKHIGFGYKNFEFFRLRLLYILRGKISGIGKKDGFQKSQKAKKSKK